MQIAGGVYLELCEVPEWKKTFGSGGRAALAVARVSPGSVLHTYAGGRDASDWERFTEQGIKIQLTASPEAFAFAYFHSLSTPVLVPSPASVPRASPMEVKGQTVLRFGMLEGEAIVEADAAVYDPQGDRTPFTGNASTASRLALVLNELEAERMGGLSRAMQDNGATVAVLKRGARGATVIASGTETHIPAYRSSRVFKIGSGDVFSAMFAYWWGEAGRSPVDAAELASRAVAQYCETASLPVDPDNLDMRQPAPRGEPGLILIEAAADTLGRRYVVEEARALLRDLGFCVVAPCIGDERPGKHPQAVLSLVGGLPIESLRGHVGQRVVILAEDNAAEVRASVGAAAVVADDFASALYLVGWMAMEPMIAQGKTVPRQSGR